MKNLKLSLPVMLILSLATQSAMAQDTSQSNANTEKLQIPAQQQIEVEAGSMTSPYLLQTAGPTLIPKMGQTELSLTTGGGSMTAAGNNSSNTSNISDEMFQMAYGIGAGFYVSGALNYATQDNQYSSNSEDKSTGLTEPQLALGYTKDLTSSEKITAQVAYAFSTGATTSTQNGNYNFNTGKDDETTNSDSKHGGSFIIPAVQFETKSLLKMTLGARLSYAIMNDSQSTSTSTFNSSPSSTQSATTHGGNLTTAYLFAQKRLTNMLSVGGTLGVTTADSSRTTDSSGSVSYGDPYNWEFASVNMPIKLGTSFAVIPSFDYSYIWIGQSSANLQVLNLSATGRFTF